MISSNSFKFVLVLLAAGFLSQSCRFFYSEKEDIALESPASEAQTNIPFETKEPEIFQAEIVVSYFLNGKKSERIYFIAKNKAKKLIVFYGKTPNERAILETDENTRYLIDRKNKTYEKKTRVGPKYEEDELKNFLTTKWLNKKAEAKFEDLSLENNLRKYRVRIADANNSEAIIFIDENLKIPVKQEFYSISGEKRKLLYSVETRSFKKEAADELFILPGGLSEK